MFVVIVGLVVGVLAGALFPGYIPKAYTVYIGVALLSALDSIIGALRARLEGTFDNKIFITGFVGNSIIAVLLTYCGKFLGLDFSIAAVVVFGTRMFANFASIRRLLLKKYNK